MMEENGVIYAKLLNELYEVVCEATGNVRNIDKEEPNEATISFNTTSVTVGETVTATVSQSDALSGIDIKNCKYAFTLESTTLGTTDADLSKYTGSFKTETNDTLTLNCPTSGTYYLHVLSVDKVGNKRETISYSSVFVESKTLTYVSANQTPLGAPILSDRITYQYSQFPDVDNTYSSQFFQIRLYGDSKTNHTSVFWKVPVLSRNCTINVTFGSDWNGYAKNRCPAFFASSTNPSSISSWPEIYAEVTQPWGNANHYDVTSYTINIDNLRNDLYIGTTNILEGCAKTNLYSLTVKFY
ncbi:MAG: hypothetical protein HFJ33_07515 [Clostridia bacterium]|nr:hypothetical protein [Clostridia bacterium]